ncbi:tripartite tricarboxylate transporter substrate binding protein [Pigmentiphaga soli]|uniref:Tripartite tricarboxylate transporter substrate binding protein n=1 Tax=Pigmentiphaga soli TaxID=1007095 RepID=A0ABP8HTM2_9BURK
MKIRALLILPALLASGIAPAWAQQAAFPSKPIRLIVPFPPGGANDEIARPVSQALAESLKQSVVIDNKGGAGGIIGSQTVAKAAPDGYTLLFISAAHAINPSLYELPYDSLADFEPVAMIGEGAYVLVANPKLPANTVPELVAYAKRHPGKLTFASAGVGNATHLAGELFKKEAQIDILHVPYKGGGPALIDVAGGQASMYFSSTIAAASFLRDKRVKPIAVTSRKRSPTLPDVPSVAESGYPDYEVTAWWAVLAPRGTPAEVVQRLNGEINRALGRDSVRTPLKAQGIEPTGGTPQAARDFIGHEIAKWRTVIAEAKISAKP